MEVSDIQVGIVVSFKGSDIKAHMPPIRELKRKYGEPSELPDDGRPYVCIGKKDGWSQWAELTTQYHHKRFLIPVLARTWENGDNANNPNDNWKNRPQYVHGSVFTGQDSDWIQIANDHATSGRYRKIITNTMDLIRAHLEPQLEDPLFPLS